MIGEILAEKQNLINKRLESLLKADCKEHQTLYSAMNYSLLAGGKRIRPFLFLTILDMLGINSEDYVDISCALECVHTYSLIHDDLPAMDNDDYRRGRLTNHKVYGAGMAMQAGDGLLTFAFQLLAEKDGISAEKKVKLISILSRAAGPRGMVGGQAHDMESEGKTLTLDELMTLDTAKTGCLLSAPVKMAGVIADIPADRQKYLNQYAYHMGLLFQITDDLIDVTSDFSKMGKMPGQDAKDNKSTFVTILGQELTEQYAEKEAALAKEALGHLPYCTKILLELIDMVLHRNK